MIFENYHLYRIGIWLVARLPRWFTDNVAVALVELNYLLNARGRNGIWANLARVLPPETSQRERHRIARGTFRNFALSIADFFRIPQMHSTNAGEFIVGVDGWEHIQAAMDARVGAILMGVHMGSWELAGAYLALHGVPITVVVLPHNDPRIDQIYTQIRENTGIEVVSVGGLMRQLYTALKRGRFVGIAADRDTSGQGLLLPFFGETTRMPQGHAKLALRTGAWILPTCVYRRSDNTVAIEVLSPIWPDPTHDTEESLALRCLAIVEDFIRARPEQWSSFQDLWTAEPPALTSGSAA